MRGKGIKGNVTIDHFRIGTRHLRTADYEAAIVEFDKAIAVHGPTLEILEFKASAYEKLGDLTSALKVARQCISSHSKSPKGYSRCSHIFQLREDWRRAAQMLDLAIPLSSRDKRPRLEALLSSLQARVTEPMEKTQDPIKVLPAEIWRNILLYGVEENADFSIGISHVSKAWRAATLAEPAAWSRLRIGSSRPIGDRALQKIAAWKKRSGGNISGIDMSLSLNDDRTTPRADKNTLKIAAESLKKVLPRVKSLRLYGNTWPSMEMVITAWKGLLRDLQELCLEGPEGVSLPRHEDGLLAKEAKSLRKLSMIGVTMDCCPFSSTQVANLRECDLDILISQSDAPCEAKEITEAEDEDQEEGRDSDSDSDSEEESSNRDDPDGMGALHRLLYQAKNLESLSLIYKWGCDPMRRRRKTFPWKRLHFPRLKTFADKGSLVGGKYTTLLRQMRVPALENIQLPMPHFQDEAMEKGFVDFEKIKELRFFGEGITPQRLCDQLDRLPALETLEVEAFNAESSEIVEHLSRHPTRWISLQSLDIFDDGLTGGPLLRLVRSRLPKSALPEKAIASGSIPRPFGAKSDRPTRQTESNTGEKHSPATTTSPPLAIPITSADTNTVLEESTASTNDHGDDEKTRLLPIKHLVVRKCPKVEKAAEDWLRKNVPSFQYIAPTRDKPTFSHVYSLW